MLVPSPRLLLVSVVVALPLASLGGMFPNMTVACAAGLVLCAAVVAFDAVAALRRIAGVALSTPRFIRLTKDVAAGFPVTVEKRGEAPAALRLGINLPAGMETETPVLDVFAPHGASVAGVAVYRTRARRPCAAGTVRGSGFAAGAVAGPPAAAAGLFLPCLSQPARPRHGGAVPDAPPASACACGARWARAANSRTCAITCPATVSKTSTGRPPPSASFPAVKLYRVEHAQEVYAMLDSSRLSAREGILESFVDAALHLALVAEKQGDRFGLVTFSDRTHKFVRARNGMDHFRLCRETIYNLHAQRVSPDFRDVFTSLQLNLRRRSLLVFFTSLDDALLADSFERDIPLLARRHLVLVNVRRTAALHPLYTGERSSRPGRAVFRPGRPDAMEPHARARKSRCRTAA